MLRHHLCTRRMPFAISSVDGFRACCGCGGGGGARSIPSNTAASAHKDATSIIIAPRHRITSTTSTRIYHNFGTHMMGTHSSKKIKKKKRKPTATADESTKNSKPKMQKDQVTVVFSLKNFSVFSICVHVHMICRVFCRRINLGKHLHINGWIG